jgi:endoglycosylceramidase
MKTYSVLYRSLPWLFLLAGCSANELAPEAPVGAGAVADRPTVNGLHAEGQFIRDEAGRAVVLRGANVTGDAKLPPFHDRAHQGIQNPEQIARLRKDWGMNIMRVLFVWEAFEPKPGQYRSDYLDYLSDIVDWGYERGIYSFIDFHQDGYSRFVSGGCGEGFPEWTLPDGTLEVKPGKVVDRGAAGCADWAVQAAKDPNMHKAWHHFYKNGDGVRKRYLDVMEKLANRFRKHPGVIAYDPMNEPWGCEIPIDLPFFKGFDCKAELENLYKDAAHAIRVAGGHKSAMLFVEGHIVTNSGAPTLLNLDVQHRPFDNFVYAPHYYNTPMMGTKVYLPTTRGATELAFHNMRATAENWKVPLLVGEFGMFANTKKIVGITLQPDNGEGAAKYMKDVYEGLDGSLHLPLGHINEIASGTQWCYTSGWTWARRDGWNGEDTSFVGLMGDEKPKDEPEVAPGTPLPTRPNFAVRPYPMRTAGTPLEFEWKPDGNGGVLGVGVLADPTPTLRYKWNNKLVAEKYKAAEHAHETELYVPATVFNKASSKDLVVTKPDGVACAFRGDVLRCQSDSDDAVEIVVKPRKI